MKLELLARDSKEVLDLERLKKEERFVKGFKHSEDGSNYYAWVVTEKIVEYPQFFPLLKKSKRQFHEFRTDSIEDRIATCEFLEDALFGSFDIADRVYQRMVDYVKEGTINEKTFVDQMCSLSRNLKQLNEDLGDWKHGMGDAARKSSDKIMALFFGLMGFILGAGILESLPQSAKQYSYNMDFLVPLTTSLIGLYASYKLQINSFYSKYYKKVDNLTYIKRALSELSVKPHPLKINF